MNTSKERPAPDGIDYRAISELVSDFAYAFSVSPDGALVCDWITEAFSATTGLDANQLTGRDGWIAVVHPEDREAYERHWAALREGRAGVCEYRVRTPQGEILSLRDHARPEQDTETGRVIRVYGAAQDVTEHKQAVEALQHLALYDGLTELPNRSLLHDRLHQAMLTARRERRTAVLLVLDLDRFKEVNDTLGHSAGDVLLKQVAKRLRLALRASDTVGRIGGDEFAIVLPAADSGVATLVAGKLLYLLEQPFQVEGHSVSISASIGIAEFPAHGEDEEVLLRRADVAMYAAKNTRNAFAVYDAGRDQHRLGRLSIVNELRTGIAEGRLVLHYQPKVQISSRRLVGVEALLRWDHPQLGLLAPEQFIPLAEESRVIKQLTPWVLMTALRQAGIWRSIGLDLPIAVNLSVHDLQDDSLPATVEQLLLEHGAPGASLLLEITEAAVTADPRRSVEALLRVHRLGVGISIDRFGTGYSSLAALRTLPVSELKIDRTFTDAMVDDPRTGALVRSIIDLARNLGCRSVAVGVQTPAAWEALAALGCDEAQGSYLSSAMPPSELMGALLALPWASR